MTRFLPLLLILLLTTTSCDSDDGPSGSAVDGRYRATSITFTQENNGTLVGTVDVLSYMAREAGGQPTFTIDLFGRDRDYTIAYQLANDNSRSSIRGGFSSESNNRVQLDLGDDPDADRVLLPSPLTLTSSTDREALTGAASVTVTFDQLSKLGDRRFDGTQGTVRGRLSIALERE